MGSQPRLRPVELESFETRERFDLIIAAVAGSEDWSGVLVSLSRLLREGATDAYGVVVMQCAEGASPVDEALASARLHLVDDLRFASPASSGEAPTAARLWGDSVFEEDLGFRLPRHHGDGCGRALILSRAAPPLAGSLPRLATRAVEPPLERSAADVSLAIFTLVRGGAHRSDYGPYVLRCTKLREATEASMAHVRYDDLAFHEGNVPPRAVLRQLERDLSVRFIDARRYGGFSTPPSLRRRGGLNVSLGGYRAGYSHMCRWFAMQWVLAVRNYEYAMRIDEDVLIERMSDPIQILRSSGANYGYGLRTPELHGVTVDTLPVWLQSYISSRGITPAKPPVNVSDIYFTNYFVTRVAWWEQPAVQRFLHAVDRTANIYTYRWGDAPLQTAALHLFENQPLAYVAVDYSHLSTENHIQSRNGSNGSTAEMRGMRAQDSSVLDRVAMRTWQKMGQLVNDCAAPCAVANHFGLPGAPFVDEPNATLALKRWLLLDGNRTRIGAPPAFVGWQSPRQLTAIVQFDVMQADSPLPPENVIGVAWRDAIARLVVPEAQGHELSDASLVRALSFSPCCYCTSPETMAMMEFSASTGKFSAGGREYTRSEIR